MNAVARRSWAIERSGLPAWVPQASQSTRSPEALLRIVTPG
jgi:hypothetical protein